MRAAPIPYIGYTSPYHMASCIKTSSFWHSRKGLFFRNNGPFWGFLGVFWRPAKGGLGVVPPMVFGFGVLTSAGMG